jgi:hypothetical protein
MDLAGFWWIFCPASSKLMKILSDFEIFGAAGWKKTQNPRK